LIDVGLRLIIEKYGPNKLIDSKLESDDTKKIILWRLADDLDGCRMAG
jgi:hypothetical protein